jgi:putative ribosome biogenesis GTPase RsgA
MGITGSGKSSFIKALTGRSDIVVGDGLESSNLFQDLTSSPNAIAYNTLTVGLACSNRGCSILSHHH